MPKKITPKANGKYLFMVTSGYVNGKQRIFSKEFECKNMSDAEKQYSLYKAECLEEKHLSNVDGKATFEQFYEYWEINYANEQLANNTIEYNTYISGRLLYAFGNSRLDKISATMCLDFFTRLKKTPSQSGKFLSDSTVRKHYKLMNELMNFAVKWDILKKNPLQNIDPPKCEKKIKQVPTPEVISIFLTHVMKTGKAKYKLCTMLAFLMGLRREEIYALSIPNIDFTATLLHIEKAAVFIRKKGIIIKSTKTSKSERVLLMPPIIVDLFKEYLAEIMYPQVVNISGYLFTGRFNSGVVALPNGFNKYLNDTCKELGIKTISPHMLRHLHGSCLINEGVDLAAVANALGHRNKSFTADTYIHAMEFKDTRVPNASQKAFEKLVNL